jgi:maltose phosphorylase
MDLDNYNRNSAEGLHTTSIAAAWMNIVYGFGGLRSDGKEIVLNPTLPEQWTEYEFSFLYRAVHIKVTVTADKITLSTNDRVSKAIPLIIYGTVYQFDSTGLQVPLCTV